jgi:CheY-like chemotaxis protein
MPEERRLAAAEMKNTHEYILIAEDDPGDCELFRLALEELKIKNRVVIVKNGVEALHILRSTAKGPFIIISDINMPRMNGLELLKEIYSDVSLRIKSIPFIFLTSSASHEEISAAYLLSAQGYFQKPMNYEELKHIFHVVINYWNASRMPV